MFTLAAGINNLKEEKNDPSFPASLTYRISDFSLLTSCFNLPCHSKIPLSFFSLTFKVCNYLLVFYNYLDLI